MLNDPGLLIIGGTGRNVGKTEFICRLITRISATEKVYGLKVSAIYPDETLFHGNHGANETSGQLFEEHNVDGSKDSSRMLRAGASRVFYLRGDGAEIEAGYTLFKQTLSLQGLIICESNSLDSFVKPGLKIMVHNPSAVIKPRALAHLDRADLVVQSDGTSGFKEMESIRGTVNSGWQLA